MRLQGPDWKKLCTVAALFLKSEQIRQILPKPGNGKTWIKRWAMYPIRRFFWSQRTEKPRKQITFSAWVSGAGAGIEPVPLLVGDFESLHLTNRDVDSSLFLGAKIDRQQHSYKLGLRQ